MERGEQLLTRQEVADFVGVSTKTISRWQKKGWLPVIRIGKLIRYKPTDVKKLFDDLTIRETS